MSKKTPMPGSEGMSRAALIERLNECANLSGYQVGAFTEGRDLMRAAAEALAEPAVADVARIVMVHQARCRNTLNGLDRFSPVPCTCGHSPYSPEHVAALIVAAHVARRATPGDR